MEFKFHALELKIPTGPTHWARSQNFAKLYRAYLPNISVQIRSLARARTRAFHRSLYILLSSVTLNIKILTFILILSVLHILTRVTANSHEGIKIRHGQKISVMCMYRKKRGQRLNKAKVLWLHLNAVTVKAAYSSFPYLHICFASFAKRWWRVTAGCTNFGVYACAREECSNYVVLFGSMHYKRSQAKGSFCLASHLLSTALLFTVTIALYFLRYFDGILLIVDFYATKFTQYGLA